MPHKAAPPPDIGALSLLAPELASTMACIASDIALVIDGDGVICSVAEGTALLSPSCNDWVGQRWVDTATADTRRKIELLLDEVRSTGVTRHREVNHPVPGGGDIPVVWAAVRLGEGGPVVAGGRDLRPVAAIQQRFLETQHEMERDYWRRKHADSRYRMLFQAANDAVLVLDASSFEILEANAAASTLVGQGGDGLVGRPWPDCLPVASRAAVRELLANARTAGRSTEVRMRLLAGAASDVSVTPFRVDDRHQLLVRARRGERAVDDSYDVARMVSFVESTPDAVVITDSAGHIQIANPAFIGLVQQGDELNLKGRLLHEVLGDREGRLRAMLTRARAQGVAPRSWVGIRGAGRTSLVVEATAALMTDGEQEYLGVTLRPSDATRAAAVAPAEEISQSLSELSAQVGHVPLEDLLAEAGQRTERHLIETAVLRAGGLVPVAAELLGLTPENLLLRLRRHGLAGRVFGGSPNGPKTIN